MSIKEAIDLAKRKVALDDECRQATLALAHAVKPMDEDEFWKVLSPFAKETAGRRGVKSACHNLMYEHIYSQTCSLTEWERMCSFLKRYEIVKAKLSKKCYEMPGLERGDDGRSDLIDSLPLAGRKVYEGILDDDIANFKQLEKALDGPLKRSILEGENYIEMRLEGAIKKAFLSIARDFEA